MDTVIEGQVHGRNHSGVRDFPLGYQLSVLHGIPLGNISAADMPPDLYIVERHVRFFEIVANGSHKILELLLERSSRARVGVGFALIPQHSSHTAARVKTPQHGTVQRFASLIS